MLLFSCSLVSDSLWPRGLQHTRLLCPLSPGICSNPHPLSQWCYLSYPLLPSSPFALSLSQYQGLFQWVGSSHQVVKVLELQLPLQPHGLYSARNSPGQNSGVDSLSLLQGIFPTQGSNPGLPHCRRILYQLSHKGSPRILEWVAYPFFNGSSQPSNRTGVSCSAGGFFTNWAIRESPPKGHTIVKFYCKCSVDN